MYQPSHMRWGPHTNSYSESDINAFQEILPSLYSKAAGKTTFPQEEMFDLMERFKKTFGGEPLFSPIEEDK